MSLFFVQLSTANAGPALKRGAALSIRSQVPSGDPPRFDESIPFLFALLTFRPQEWGALFYQVNKRGSSNIAKLYSVEISGWRFCFFFDSFHCTNLSLWRWVNVSLLVAS